LAVPWCVCSSPPGLAPTLTEGFTSCSKQDGDCRIRKSVFASVGGYIGCATNVKRREDGVLGPHKTSSTLYVEMGYRTNGGS